MTRRSRRFAPLVVAIALVTIASGSPSAGAASPTPASVRIFATKKNVTLEHGRKRVYLNLGTWITPVGGNLEMVARRPYGSPLEVSQMDAATGNAIRSIPPELLAGWNGLAGFTEVTFRDSAGRIVTELATDFCPNSYERQRVNDEGPLNPTYPTFCTSYAPFTRGMVWGVDESWAVGALTSYTPWGEGQAPYVKLPDGTYNVTVQIADPFVEFFQVAPEDSAVRLTVTVKTVDDNYHDGGPIPHARAAERQAAAVPTVTDPDPDTLPDLAALPAWAMGTYHRRSKDLLSFASTPWNEGPAPLVVEGFRRDDADVMDAYQYFMDENGNATGRAAVGELEFDTRRGHQHWHFLQFARYTLLDAAGEEVVRSRKQAFCIAHTDVIDLTVPGADLTMEGQRLHTSCGSPGSLWIRETLGVGWGDTYFQSSAGQAFNITHVPNGWYTVRVEVDPLDVLLQADESNDIEDRLVYIGGKPGRRNVKVAPWHGMEI